MSWFVSPGGQSNRVTASASVLPMNIRGRRGSAVACCRVWGTEFSSACMESFEGGHHYLHYLHHSLASGQASGREHSLTQQHKIGLKIYWTWPHPSEQDPVSASDLLSYQEASISLLSSPSEGRQNENQNHSQLTKLITWTTALSNSMKLWAMLCRATQDGWVVVESSHKMWSTGEGNGKPLQYSCLENPMRSIKRQKKQDSCQPAKYKGVGFPGGSGVKNPPANAEDMGLIPNPRRSHMPWSN